MASVCAQLFGLANGFLLRLLRDLAAERAPPPGALRPLRRSWRCTTRPPPLHAPARRVGRDDWPISTRPRPSALPGELVAAAAAALVAPCRPEELAFVEPGAASSATSRTRSPPTGPFPSASSELPPEAVAFNFVRRPAVSSRRLARRLARAGVALHGRHRHVELPALPELRPGRTVCPVGPGRLSIPPLRTVPLLNASFPSPGAGLFLAFDYGKSWPTWPRTIRLAPDAPTTGRRRHRSAARPGRQDLTCHICWDGGWTYPGRIRLNPWSNHRKASCPPGRRKLAAMMSPRPPFSPRNGCSCTCCIRQHGAVFALHALRNDVPRSPEPNSLISERRPLPRPFNSRNTIPNCAITGRRPVKGSIINRKGQSKKSGGIGTTSPA